MKELFTKLKTNTSSMRREIQLNWSGICERGLNKYSTTFAKQLSNNIRTNHQ